MEKKPVSPITVQPYVPAPVAPIQQPESPQMMMPTPQYVLPQECPPYPMQPMCCPPMFNPCCHPRPRPCGCRPIHHPHFFPTPYHNPYIYQGQNPWGY
jgi:hypothetical protein